MTETLEQQIDRLAKFLMKHYPSEIDESGGAIDVAIKILDRHTKESEESSERYNKLATPLMNLHSEIHKINDEAGE